MKKHCYSYFQGGEDLHSPTHTSRQAPSLQTGARPPFPSKRQETQGEKIIFCFKFARKVGKEVTEKIKAREKEFIVEIKANKKSSEMAALGSGRDYSSHRGRCPNLVKVAASMGLAVVGLSGAWWMQQPANCASATPAQSRLMAQAATKATNNQLVAANTKFGFKLFSEIRKQDARQNIFISPTSVAIALSLTYNGANGPTQDAIARTLEVEGMSLQQVNAAHAELKASLSHLDAKVHLAIANSLWGKSNEPFKPDFIQKTQDFYGAQVRNVDFSSPDALNIINNWIQQSTNGKIQKVLEKEDLNSSTIAILINAIYFQANWLMPFSKEKTENRPFTLLDGTQKMHPMMFRAVDSVLYYKNEIFQAIGLPYEDGRLSMYIFLPNPGVNLKTFYENLNAENWQQWMNQFQLEEAGVLLGLPRFRVEYEVELKDFLKVLGMDIAFNDSADFTGMTPQGLSITKIKHKTYLDVNEQGTEAAGVTAVASSRGSGPHVSMIVDRPFFCAIRDEETGTILFMGSIVEPK